MHRWGKGCRRGVGCCGCCAVVVLIGGMVLRRGGGEFLVLEDKRGRGWVV